MSTFHAALEIDASRTVLAIGEADAGGRMRVISHAEIPSAGVRKSQIVNIDQASHSIKSVLKLTEKQQETSGVSITLGNAFLVVSGQSIRSRPVFRLRPGRRVEVGDEEVDGVMAAARRMTLARDRELLDVVDQDYVLDRLGGISSPRGMSGRVLSLNTLRPRRPQPHPGRAHGGGRRASGDPRPALRRHLRGRRRPRGS